MAANIEYPPKRVSLLGLKSERVLEVYSENQHGEYSLIRKIPVCAASGTKGPKLREGDRQVPEGIYRISFLNPNSSYHVSLRVDYPNQFDRIKAQLDRRSKLGGDIMIHGSCVSIGCLAMEDEAAEDLFTLAFDVGLPSIEVILAPFDFRKKILRESDFEGLPAWSGELYESIQKQMGKLPGISN